MAHSKTYGDFVTFRRICAISVMADILPEMKEEVADVGAKAFLARPASVTGGSRPSSPRDIGSRRRVGRRCRAYGLANHMSSKRRFM